MDWWNPCAKSFRDVMRKRGKKKPKPRNARYGVIEKNEEGKFVASIYRLMTGEWLCQALDAQPMKPNGCWRENSIGG